MDHLHGSTAIAGLAHTKDSSFPRSMRGQLVSGNVMTCRINRNQLQYSGATAQAIELPDLLTSEDSWFRPVDLVFGPDGHLYVADFYNKVIGHYEVPLDHPDRDRTSGRLWRIRSTELANRIERISTAVDVSADSSLNKPLAELDLTQTSTAMRWLKTIESIADNPDIGSLRSMLPLVEKVEQSKDPILMQSFLIALRKCILGAMEKDSNATSSLLRSTNAPESTFSAPRYAIMLKVLLATKDSRCHSVALDLLDRKLSSLKNGSPQERTEWGQAMEKLIGVADDQNVERLLDLLHRDDSLTADKPSLYANRLLTLLQRQLQSRGKLSSPVVSAARNTMEFLASDWLHRFEKNHSVVLDWMATTPGKRDDRKDWPIEPRKRRLPGEQETSPLDIYSSFPLGESYQGSWGTAPMLAPEKWSFYIAGHNGLPNMPDHQKNFARLISLDLRSGETKELFRAYPPRNDVAKWVEWELKEYAGQPVLFEVVDGDAGSSYAWLGVGGFSADALAMDVRRSDYALIQSFVSLIGLEDAKHSPALWKWVSSPILSESCKLRIWKKSWLENQPIDTEILSYAMETQQWDLARRFFWETPDAKDLHFSEAFSVWKQQYRQLFRRWSASQQTKIIHRISKYRGAPERLAEWIESSLLSPDVVSTLPPSWWGGLSKSESDRLATIKTLAEKSANRSDRIESKLASIKRETVDLEIGKKMYADKCAQCHKLGSVGNVLGPQLEGIGNRGLERLCEDILWPDRNVDEAFRVTLLLLDGGETVTGLVQERNDASITIAEQNGTKRVIPIMDIEQEKKGEVSLMPSNFDEVLTTKELACLLEFLRTEVSKNKGN
jgi:putative heme-binding domain-containing protein